MMPAAARIAGFVGGDPLTVSQSHVQN